MYNHLFKFLLILLFLHQPFYSFSQNWVGADEANERFGAVSTANSSTNSNYMALADLKGVSGVPLGGIGAGCVQFTPDGTFVRTTGINNWFTDAVTGFRKNNTELEKGHFIAVWQKLKNGETVARRLQKDNLNTCGLKGYPHSVFKGLFPTAEVYFTQEGYTPQPSPASVKVWSGFVANDLKATTSPCFWVEVTLANSDRYEESAVAFSWADLLGKGLMEPKNMETLPTSMRKGYSSFKEVTKPDTKAEEFFIKNGWRGILQTLVGSHPQPKKMTFQTAVKDVVILAQEQKDATITILPAYNIANSEQAWSSFIKNGEFSTSSSSKVADLSNKENSLMASAVAIKAKIPVGEKRTFRFLISWYAPEVEPDATKNNDPKYKYGVGDYGAWYQNNYKSITDVANYASISGDKVLGGISEWQNPILNSNMPDWLKFKLINSAYSLFTNGFINRSGDYTNMEGGMDGLAATSDVRMIMHPLVQKFFHEVDRHEMKMFSVSQEPVTYIDGVKNLPSRVGAIPHMLGNYFTGLATTTYPGPTPIDVNMDGTCAYIMQIVKDYEQTGDMTWLKEREQNIILAVKYLKNNIVDNRGIPYGRATFDDYKHPKVFAYNASMFLMGLNASILAGKYLGNKDLEIECEKLKTVANKGYMSLWNGRFFAYGADSASTVLINDRFHQGQIGGQSLNRYCGWDDIVSPQMLNAVFTTQCKDVLSKVPYRYANKVWDLSMNRGVDAYGSQCWPFLLESLTAMPMIQNGWIDDAFDIMQNIQKVHLFNGWGWTQNLWNPGELTRMDAPTTWMVLENLAGAALNVPQQTLTLGPGLIPGEDQLIIPLYFPDFWANLTYQPKLGNAKLEITKIIGEKEIIISKLKITPIGKSSFDSKTVNIKPFKLKQGAVLNLNPYISMLAPNLHKAVLTRAAQEPYVEVSISAK